MTHQTSALANLSPASVPSAVDYSAMGVSSLCILHCLAAPALAGVLPLAGAWANAEWAHKALVVMAVPISVYAAFVRGMYFRDRIFVFFVTLGLALLTAAAFVEKFHDIEKQLTAAGAFILAGSHLWRWRCHFQTQQMKVEEDYVDKT